MAKSENPRIFAQMSDQYQIESCFRLWYKPLCLYALHFLGSIDESEDAVQDVFCNLMQKAQAGGYVLLSKAYIYTSVRNKCLDILKSTRTRDTVNSLDGIDVTAMDDADLTERSIEEARMWAAIDSLPKKCRRIFLMNKVQGMKYSEIADGLGISENTVRNQIAKALKTIKEGVRKVVLFLLSL